MKNRKLFELAIFILLSFFSLSNIIQAEKVQEKHVDSHKLHLHFESSSDFPILLAFIEDHLDPDKEKTIKNIEASLATLNEKWDLIQKYRNNLNPINDPNRIHLLESDEFKELGKDLNDQDYQELEGLFHEIKRFIDHFQGLKLFKESHISNAENITEREGNHLKDHSRIAAMFRDLRKGGTELLSKITEKIADNKLTDKLIDWLSNANENLSEEKELIQEKIAKLKEEIISDVNHSSNKNDFYNGESGNESETFKEETQNQEGFVLVNYTKEEGSPSHEGKFKVKEHPLLERDESKQQISQDPPPEIILKRKRMVFPHIDEEESIMKQTSSMYEEIGSPDIAQPESINLGDEHKQESILDKIETGKDYIKDKVEEISDLASKSKDFVKEKLQASKEYLSEKSSNMVNKGEVLYQTGKEAVENSKESLKNIGSKISETIDKAEDSLKNVLEGPVETVTEKLESMRETLGEKLIEGKDFMKEKIGGEWDYLSGKKDDFVNKIIDSSDKIQEKFTEGKEYIQEKVGQGLDYLSSKKDDVVNKIIRDSDDLHGHLGDRIKENLREGRDYMQEKAGEGMDYLSHKKDAIVDSVIGSSDEINANLGKKIKERLIEAKDYVQEKVVEGMDYISSKKDDVINKIIDYSDERHGHPGNRVKGTAEDVNDSIKRAKKEVSEEPSSIIGRTSEYLKDKFEKAKEFLTRNKNGVNNSNSSPGDDSEDIEEEIEDESLLDEEEIEKVTLNEKAKELLLIGENSNESKVSKEEDSNIEDNLGDEGLEGVEMGKLTEKQIIEELIHHFNPDDPRMQDFVEKIKAAQKKKNTSTIPETSDSLWKKIKEYFKYRFPIEGWTISEPKNKYIEIKGGKIHPHHLDERHLKPDHIYQDDEKDYFKDKRNQFLDEILGKEDLFFYFAKKGMDYYDVRQELMDYLVEGTDSEISTWDDDPSSRHSR